MYKAEANSFMDLCLKGKVMLDEIDDYIARWHRSAQAIDILSYLGMTKEEYDLFVRDPDALAFIVTARRENRSLRDVVNENYHDELRIAARAAGSLGLKRLKRWLTEHED